jgi:signal transduction histidine kinase
MRLRLSLPRRTARLRLTVLYGGACLTFGAILLGITYLLTWSALTAPLSAHPEPGPPPSARAQSADPQQADSQQTGQIQPQNGAEQTITVDRQLLLARSGIALGIVTVAAAGAGWLLAGRVLRPLSTITAAARRISASSLNQRLALQGPDDELKELGDTLDGLFARLDASFSAQRRFAANASHELRTPLTRERALLQVTLADPASTAATWQAVSRELLASNAEQERLIEALLTLASSEAGLSAREPVDLAGIAKAALDLPRPGTARLGLNVGSDLQPAVLRGDSVLIQQLVANLVDNAVGHNVAGGDVLVATGTRHGRAVVSVANSGQVIPAAEVDRLLQPFQQLGTRSARRGHGHGLGLSIVKAIAVAHDAALTLRPRPGGGLVAEVAFPAPPPAWPRPASQGQLLMDDRKSRRDCRCSIEAATPDPKMASAMSAAKTATAMHRGAKE